MQKPIEFLKANESSERLLQSDPNKYVMFPIQEDFRDIFEQYKKQSSMFWFTDEIDIVGDIDDWNLLDPDMKDFITHVLAFFAASDGIVNENISCNFGVELENSSVRAYYTMQAAIESIHSETYSSLIQAYIPTDEERQRCFNAIETMPCVAKKAQWAEKWMDSSIPFAIRIMAFCIVEGVFFSGSFCAIFWLKDHGVNLKGLFASNELISRDEALHCETAVKLFKKLKYIPDESTVHDIFRDAVNHEIEFVEDALTKNMIGMNSELMSQYIRFVGDRLLMQLGYSELYGDDNPFDFMTRIGLDNISNFHNRRPTEYSKENIKKINHTFDFSTENDDF